MVSLTIRNVTIALKLRGWSMRFVAECGLACVTFGPLVVEYMYTEAKGE